ncbi:hypothetical protein [Thorsellia kenyensis]|uniref:Uncharacterized protein n=1 Tax=Thorsellia kenyensis TaxID=1549888 RepID=A0ABV6C6D9_9GAMM
MANKFTTFSSPLESFFDKVSIREFARKTRFMPRMRLLQPEKFFSALIQILSLKDHANLADILRKMHSEQEASQYKPFHNQIKKAECTKFIQTMVEEATKVLFLAPFKQALPKETPFKNIFLHDDSSLTLNPRLTEEFLVALQKRHLQQ